MPTHDPNAPRDLPGDSPGRSSDPTHGPDCGTPDPASIPGTPAGETTTHSNAPATSAGCGQQGAAPAVRPGIEQDGATGADAGAAPASGVGSRPDGAHADAGANSGAVQGTSAVQGSGADSGAVQGSGGAGSGVGEGLGAGPASGLGGAPVACEAPAASDAEPQTPRRRGALGTSGGRHEPPEGRQDGDDDAAGDAATPPSTQGAAPTGPAVRGHVAGCGPAPSPAVPQDPGHRGRGEVARGHSALGRRYPGRPAAERRRPDVDPGRPDGPPRGAAHGRPAGAPHERHGISGPGHPSSPEPGQPGADDPRHPSAETTDDAYTRQRETSSPGLPGPAEPSPTGTPSTSLAPPSVEPLPAPTPRPADAAVPPNQGDRTATAGAAESPQAPQSLRGGRLLVPVLAFGGISVAVMQTLIVPVVAQLPELLGTSASSASWVVTATLLSGAVATPIMGRLGDLLGKRRMILFSLALMVLGSLVCAVTSQLVPMVVGRAVQGFAMGAIPLGISIMRDELPPERLGSAMAFMSSSLGVGGALGMPAAAYVAQTTDWHVLFLGCAGLGLLAIALVWLLVPSSGMRTPGRFDVVGALGLSIGLVTLLLPVSKGAEWGWGSPTTLGLLGGCVLVLLAWGWWELRTRDPLVDLRTTAKRQVLLTNLASITVGFAFYVLTLVLPQLLQLPAATGFGLGQSMLVAGLCIAPMGLAMMAVSSLSAKLSESRGPKVSLMAGQALLAVAYLAGVFLLGEVWQAVVVAVLVGVGIGVAYSAMPALILGAVDPSESGAANGLNTLMRSIGTSSSSAVIGVVLARMTTPFGGGEVPQLAGFRTAFLIAAGAAVLGMAIAAFLPAGARTGGRGEIQGRGGPSTTPRVPAPREELTTVGSAEASAPGALPRSGG